MDEKDKKLFRVTLAFALDDETVTKFRDIDSLNQYVGKAESYDRTIWLRDTDYRNEALQIGQKAQDLVHKTKNSLHPGAQLQPRINLSLIDQNNIHDLLAIASQITAVLPHLSNLEDPYHRTWLEWVEDGMSRVQLDTRRTGIMPSSLKGKPALVEGESNSMGILPILPFEKTGVIPALPLDLYDHAGGRKVTRGGGEALELRLWIAAVLSVPVDQRSTRSSISLTLEEVKKFLYPRGWHRARQLRLIINALERLNNLYLPSPDGRTSWQVVNTRQNFAMSAQDHDRIILEIALPPGNVNGALIDKRTLFLYGLTSAPKFRALVRLSYMWNDAEQSSPGTKQRIYLTIPEVKRNRHGEMLDQKGKAIRLPSGKPSMNWNHPHAVRTGKRIPSPMADKLPILTLDDLINLFFHGEKLNRKMKWKYKNLAIKYLEEMHLEGVLDYEDVGLGWRIARPLNMEKD